MDQPNAQWLERFREIIIEYNQNRQPDPFMQWFSQWFKKEENQGSFTNDKERILAILIDARFDQMTTAEKALENTKMVIQAGCLKEPAGPIGVPLLIPRQYMTAEMWTHSFLQALPRLRSISNVIISKRTWRADELSDLMLYKIKAPYLGVKTTRLAIRWLHELIPTLNIDMHSYEIPIDRLVFRVSARLGLIDPINDKYEGKGSVADVKIQKLVKGLLPGQQWIFDEPLWSTGRKASRGGHCYPTSPNCYGCLFQIICPRKNLDFDPAIVGMQNHKQDKIKVPKVTVIHREKQVVGPTPRQIAFAKFVAELTRQGIHGEEYRERVSQWNIEHRDLQ